MNRYTFKAKRKDNGEWVYGYYLCDNWREIPRHAIIEERNNPIDFDLIEIIPETLCQCTGLQDIDGNYIFEGDICIGNGHIENDNEKFIIKYGKYKTDEWKEKYFCNTYQFGWYAEFIKTKSQVQLVSPNGIEVIGNKFDKEND